MSKHPKTSPCLGPTHVAIRLVAVVMLLWTASTSAAQTGSNPSCYAGATSSGTELFITGDDSTLVGCVFRSLSQAVIDRCAANNPGNPWPLIQGVSCHVCVRPEMLDDVTTGAWGLLRTKYKPWRYPVDLSCLGGGASQTQFPPSNPLSCAEVPSGLVGWWSFDEGAGVIAEDWLDESPGNLLGNPPPGWGAGRVDHAVVLGGSNYVEVPATYLLDVGADDFSFDAWIRTEQTTGVRVLLDKRRSSPYLGYHLYLYNGRLGMQLANGGYTNYNTQSGFVADGDWHHVAVTVDRDDAQGIRWYIDGVELPETHNPTGRQGSLDNARPLRLGARSLGSPGGYWTGEMDELDLHIGVLTPAEIAAIYQASSTGKCR